MSNVTAQPEFEYQQTDTFLQLHFNKPRQALSSAILNGGLGSIEGVLNLKVPKQLNNPPNPTHTLEQFIAQQGWSGRYLGKMTAASMDSFRIARQTSDRYQVTTLVTTGLGNAKRVGEPAEETQTGSQAPDAGTINMIVICNQQLADHALAEAFMLTTEAKTAVLQDLNIHSAFAEGIATGTGTDALTIVSGEHKPMAEYCGKHTELGECMALSVMNALQDSLAWEVRRLQSKKAPAQ